MSENGMRDDGQISKEDRKRESGEIDREGMREKEGRNTDREGGSGKEVQAEEQNAPSLQFPCRSPFVYSNSKIGQI